MTPSSPPPTDDARFRPPAGFQGASEVLPGTSPQKGKPPLGLIAGVGIFLAIAIIFIATRESPCLPNACDGTLAADQQRQTTGKPVMIYFNGWATDDLRTRLTEDVLLEATVQAKLGQFVQLEILQRDFSDKATALLELGYFGNGRIDMPTIHFFDAQKRQTKVLGRVELASLAASPTGAEDFLKTLEDVEEAIRVRGEEEEGE